MREKPVPVRVDTEMQRSEGEISMENIKQQASFDREMVQDDGDATSEELPSMVSVVSLSSSSESPVENNTTSLPSPFDFRPNLDIPGEFDFLNKDSVSESQKQAIKFGVRVFRDWLNKQGVKFQSLEDMSRAEIANALEQFYLTARRPNGTHYKKNTLKSIKHSLDHYLRSSPLKKEFSISTDYEFRQVNRTLENLPADADQNRFPHFTKEIILKLYQSGQLGLHTNENPGIVIQTVWFYIVAYFFTNIDKRLLRDLTDSSLVLEKDEDDREYYWLNYKPPDRIRGDVEKSRMYARPGSLCCPVAMIKKYMEHRNPRNNVLFQHPKKTSALIWYSPLPLGKNKHTDLMKSMSVNAGIKPPLTGRCIRSYVQELLRECDQTVNEMFRLETPLTPSPVTWHSIILPKSSGESGSPATPSYILAVPRIPSPLLSTSVSTAARSIQSVQPSLPTTGNYDASHSATMITVTNQHDTSNNSNVSSHFKPTQYSRFASQNTTISNRAKSQNDPSAIPSCTLLTSILQGTSNHQTTPISTTSTPSTDIEGDVTKQITCNAGMFALPPTGNDVMPRTTAEATTQTEDENGWLGSAYHKADLKTRNKMRLQARKSLLSFLEELNDISDGHATELFYEIVQEDMNMWKSIK